MGGLKRLARNALLAGVAALGAIAVVGSLSSVFEANGGSVAYSQTARHPVGFAETVNKVKPAVISVRVRLVVGPRLMDDGSS